jgi:hypothetical protein
MRTDLIHKTLKIVILCLALVALVSLTDPNRLPSAASIIPFILIFLILYLSVMALFGSVRRETDRKIIGLKVVRPRVVAVLVAGFPVLILVLQSIGQLSSRDALTAGAIFVLAYFYATKFSTDASVR